MELTSGAIDQLEAVASERGSLRGYGANLERARCKDGAPNKAGKVLVTVKPAREGLILPRAFDVVPHVARSWGFDPAAIDDFMNKLPPPETRLNSPDELKRLAEQTENKLPCL